MLFPTLFACLFLVSPVALAPTDKKRVFILHGPIKSRHLLRRGDGTAHLDDLLKEASYVRAKYERNVRLTKASAHKLKTRQVQTGTEALNDEIDHGIDLLYDGKVSVGTPSQSVLIDFDTGSSDLVIPVDCSNCTHGTFTSRKSSTYESTGQDFSITYGDGSVSGVLAADTVSVAGLTVAKQYFGAIRSDFAAPAEGILGMAFPSIASTGKTPFVHNLVNAKALSANLFSFNLKRQAKTGSTLTIGAIAGNSAAPVYTAVTSQTYWEVRSTGFVVGKGGKGPSFPAAVDTGTTLIYLPTAVAKALYKKIPRSSSNEGDDGTVIYQFPCSSTLPEIALTFAGASGTFPINPDDLNIGPTDDDSSSCVGSIAGMNVRDRNGEAFAILGDAFLKSYTSVFDIDGARVGFATPV